MFLFKEILNEALCKNNPDSLIVFGDNLISKGKLGQAIIRDCPNSFGVPTKRLPAMSSNAFFSDKKDEYEIVRNKLIFLWREHEKGKTIILPTNPIGSGLADLKNKSPKINTLIERFYKTAKENSK